MKVSALAGPALVAVLVASGVNPPATLERAAPSIDHRTILADIRTTDAAQRRAVRDGRWEAFIDVGDAYRRIAIRAAESDAMNRRARDAYAAALRSARHAESLDGVLRVADAFAQLGDRDDVELSLHIARGLAGSDPESVADVKAATARLSDLFEAPRVETRVDD